MDEVQVSTKSFPSQGAATWIDQDVRQNRSLLITYAEAIYGVAKYAPRQSRPISPPGDHTHCT